MNALALSFHDTQIDIIDRNQQPWLRVGQIAHALSYKDYRDCIKLYSRNADEFTDSMTALELDTEGGKEKVRIFSLRGCHLLAMFARTAFAKEFRKWVLDILEQSLQRAALPEPPTLTKAQIGVLFNSVNGICAGSGKIRAELWSRFQNHFNLSSYKDLPADRYEEALTYLDAKETEYLGGPVQMLYLSSTELEAKVQARVKALEGELLGKSAPLPKREVRGGIYEAGEQIAITSFYQKEELLRHFGQLGYDLVNRNDYLVVKKSGILPNSQNDRKRSDKNAH